MSNYSIRAFDQAQRRKRYPERKGAAGLAYMQRDLLSTQKLVSEISDVLWGANVERLPDEQAPANIVHDKLSDIGLLLLQLSGALGLDFVSIMKARLEKEELSVV